MDRSWLQYLIVNVHLSFSGKNLFLVQNYGGRLNRNSYGEDFVVNLWGCLPTAPCATYLSPALCEPRISSTTE